MLGRPWVHTEPLGSVLHTCTERSIVLNPPSPRPWLSGRAPVSTVAFYRRMVAIRAWAYHPGRDAKRGTSVVRATAAKRRTSVANRAAPSSAPAVTARDRAHHRPDRGRQARRGDEGTHRRTEGCLAK